MRTRKTIACIISMALFALCISINANAKVIEPEVVKTEKWVTSYYLDDDLEELYPFIRCEADIYNDGTVKLYLWNMHEWDGFATVSHRATIVQTSPTKQSSALYCFHNGTPCILSNGDTYTISENDSAWVKEIDVSYYPTEYEWNGVVNSASYCRRYSFVMSTGTGEYVLDDSVEFPRYYGPLPNMPFYKIRPANPFYTFKPTEDPTGTYEFRLFGHDITITPELLSGKDVSDIEDSVPADRPKIDIPELNIFRKYFNPDYDFDMKDSTLEYLQRNCGMIWGDIRHYNTEFESLYLRFTAQNGYNSKYNWYYIERPVYFGYLVRGLSEGESADYDYFYEAFDDITPTWSFGDLPIFDYSEPETRYLTAMEDWLSSVGAESIEFSYEIGPESIYGNKLGSGSIRLYRLGTVCGIVSRLDSEAIPYLGNFVSDCNATAGDMIEALRTCYTTGWAGTSRAIDVDSMMEYGFPGMTEHVRVFDDDGYIYNLPHIEYYRTSTPVSLGEKLYYGDAEIYFCSPPNSGLISDNPVTSDEYQTITYRNGSAITRLKTDTDLSDIQDYINQLESENARLKKENADLEVQLDALKSETPDNRIGDIDNSGEITIRDVNYLLRYYTELKVSKTTTDSLAVWFYNYEASKE